MSTVDPFTPGATMLHYRLLERIGTTVWRAEDTRNGRTVAIKVLTKQMPKDPARRDGLLREIRQNAALFHSFVVPIQDILLAGDALLMVMDFIDGEPVSKRVRGRAMERDEFFRVAYQLTDALRFLHAKNFLHGNVNGDSVLLTANGQVKLAGINGSNLVPRKDGSSNAYQQKGSDPRTVAYLAPEQISAQTADAKSDVWSAGVVMYEMATGRQPFAAATVGEVAHKIVEEQPPSPKAINPAIDNAVVGIFGRCLFRDPFKRPKDMKALAEDIARVAPEALAHATELTARIAAQPVAEEGAGARNAILLVAQVSGYEELNANDPAAAAKASSRMQQLVGEAVYLFDGQVIDPFGPRLVGEMPSVEAALEAARKSEFDLSPSQQGSDPIAVSLLLHGGNVVVRDGAVEGAAAESATAILRELPPLTLHISEGFLKHGRGNLRLRDAGARGGHKLYTIVPPEPATIEVTTADLEAIAAAEEADLQAAQAVVAAQTAKKNRKQRAIAAAVVLAAAAGTSFLLWRKIPGDDDVRRKHAAVALVPAAPTAAHPKTIAIAPFGVDGADALLTARANAIRLASHEVLRSYPELRISDAAAGSTPSFAAKLQPGAPDPLLVPSAGSRSGAAVPAPDVATGVQAFVRFVAAELKLPPREPFTSAAAMNSFADALSANAANDAPKTETALRAAIAADPRYLPAQLMALSFFTARGNEKAAIDAAKQVVELDPANLDAARRVAHDELRSGDVGGAFAVYGSILRQKPADVESLNLVARYAAGVGDAQRFNAALVKLRKADPKQVTAHDPDILLAAGKVDDAVNAYYDVEVKIANNPALSLKIGRLSVLRRSMSIAEIELKKLETLDPNYGLHILKAYMAAAGQNRAVAESELKLALPVSSAGDEYYTDAAEVYAMLGDTGKVIGSLEIAAQRKEPTVNYVLLNPLFSYLRSDARFQNVRVKLATQQQEMRTALGQVPL
jgi:tetratricopeptide (TPR) repeat protein